MRVSVRYAVILASTAIVGAGAAATGAGASVSNGEIPKPPGPGIGSEILRDRTATSSTWALRDGQKITRVASEPVRWKDRNGTWKPIDPRLRSNSGSREVASVADGQVSLPVTANAENAIEIRDGRGSEISLELENAVPRRSTGAKGGTRREYRQVQRGVTQRVTITGTGMKEELVLRDRQSPQRFSYRLRVSDGMVPVVQPDGGINVLRGTSTVFQIPRSVLYEERVPEQRAVGAPYRLTRLGAGDWRVHVDGDAQWMNDRSRSWPVVVDPTVVIYRLNPTKFCRMDDAYSTVPGTCGVPGPTSPVLQTARIGWDARGGIVDHEIAGHALYAQFDVPEVVRTSPLLEARLNFYVTESVNTTGAPQSVRISGPRMKWLPSCPSPRPTYIPYCETSYKTLNISKPVGAVPGWMDFDVAAEMETWYAEAFRPGQPFEMHLFTTGVPRRASGTAQLPTAACNAWYPIHYPGKLNYGVWDALYLAGVVCNQNYVKAATGQHADATKHPYLDVHTTSRAQSGSQVEAPAEGKLTSRFVELRAEATSENVSSARFQYIAGVDREWRSIPLGALKFKTTGAQPGGSDIDVADGRSTRLVWDLDRTPGGEADGPVQVRAVLDAGSAGGGGVTPVRNFRIDRKNPETSSQERVGPADVDLMTGDAAITETDVDVPAFVNRLQLTRTYHSRGGSPRTTDMFGPGWTGSFEVDGGEMPYRGIYNFTDVKESEEVVDWMVDDSNIDWEYFDLADLEFIPITELKRSETHYAVLEKADGSKISFREEGTNNWVVDAEAPNLTVSKNAGGFTVTDADGSVTTFAVEKAGSPNYRPTSYRQVGSTKNTTFAYANDSGRWLLKRVVAPALEGVTCGEPPLPAGCRALELDWVSKTVGGKTVKRVDQVRLLAVDPSNPGGASSTVVAKYGYDAEARLIRVSDPRTPTGLPTDYTYDSEGRLSTYTAAGERPWSFGYQSIDGDSGNGRVRTVTRKTPTGADATRTFVYNVPLSGAGAPNDLSVSTVGTWGQTDRPQIGTAVFPPDAAPSGSGTPTSWERATIHYLGVHGKTVNVADAEGNIKTTEHDLRGNVVRELTASNRERSLAAADPVSRSHDLDTQQTYAENGVDLLRTFGPERSVRQGDGSTALVRKYVTTTYDYGKPSSVEGDQHLATEIREGGFRTADSYAIDEEVTRLEYSDGTNHRGWQVKKPLKMIVGTGSEAATTRYTYHPTYPLLTEKRLPKSAGTDPHLSVYSYYGIGSRPSWCDSGAGLANAAAVGGQLCAVLPGSQPSSGPELVGTYYRYSVLWDPLEQRQGPSSATIASAPTRVTSISRDGLGRETSRSVVASTGRAIPAVSMTYEATSGKLSTVASAAIGSEPARTTTRTWDDNGRLATYTDADGGTTTYSYDVNGRAVQVADPRGSRLLGYDDRDKISSVTDSRLSGAVTATRDADGQMVEETLPGGLRARWTIDEGGATTEKRWERTTGCSGSACTLSTSSATRDAQGRIATADSGDAVSQFDYDALGRLARSREQRGDICTQRDYGFDKNFNRTSLVTAVSGSGGACGSGASTTVSNTFDNADRVRNTGYSYDLLGRTTAVPATDSPDGNSITLTYDVDDLVASIEAGTSSQAVDRDPLRRMRRDVSEAAGLSSTTSLLRYSDDSDAPAAQTGSWGWRRYVVDADGMQVATVTDDGSASWVLTDIRGSVVATMPATATAPDAGQEYDEYGNATRTFGSAGPQGLRLGWLGGHGKQSAFVPGGLVHMGARVYNPVSGRFLQIDPVEGASESPYDYCGQDPVNCLDLDGEMRLPSKCSLFPWMCAIKNAVVKPIDGARCVSAISSAAVTAGKGVKAAIATLKGGGQIKKILSATKSKDEFMRAIRNGKKGVTFGGVSAAHAAGLVQWIFDVEGIVDSCKRIWPKG